MLFGSAGVFAQTETDEKETTPAAMADYENPKLYYIKDITVSGIQYLNTDIIAASTGLQKGDSVYLPSSYLSQAASRLWSQRYFSDVDVLAHIEGDSINVELVLTERPRVYKWDIKGVRKGEKTELLDNMKLKRGHELSDFVLTNSKNSIYKFLAEKGFRNTTVETKIENDTTIKNGVNVTFLVDKGSRVKIADITFEGNEAFTDGQLRRALKKVHRKSWKFWSGAKLKDKEYAEAMDNLLDHYNSRGYRNATIVKDSIYPVNSKRIGVDITMDEGNKYYFRNITWVGNSKYETERLQAMLGIESGDLYDKRSLEKRLGIGKEGMNPDYPSISSLYQNAGYLMFNIDPAETIIGNDSIDLQMRIFEGKQFTVNEVGISGNLNVNDEVIRREMYVYPGELYDRSMLMNTMRQLMQMSHFNPEAMTPDIQPISNELVNINWALTEQASDQFEVSGGWGAGMFVFSVGVTLKNLSLRDFLKKDAWRPFPRGQNQQLSVRAQSNGTYYKAFSLSFLEPWLGGRKPNSLSVSAYYSEESNAYYAWQAGSGHFRTLGVSAGLGHRLKWPDPYFSIYYEASYQNYNLKDWGNYFIIDNGNAHVFALKGTLSRNSVDQPIYPRNGSEFAFTVAATPPYSLWDGKKYSDPNLSKGDRYKWVEYYKMNVKAKWHYPLTNNNNLVLMARAEMGYLGSYDKNKPSPFEGFDVGGDGMSGYNLYGVENIGMRGYENSSLTPKNESASRYATVYNKYTLELRYPFILQPSSTIYGLVFAEAGNAYPSWKKFDPFLLKRSAGFGVRLYLPMIGLIGVDWGYGFDNQYGERQKHGSQFHFMMGHQF